MMYQLIKDLPQQIEKALQIGNSLSLKVPAKTNIQNIVVSGLGGSGIGGNILSELLREQLQIPVIVSKSYFLPAFVNEHSLLILSSYSGNTEETISCALQAIEKGLQPVCITSGGKLEEIALQHGLNLIKIPAGFPPRTCLGYSASMLFYVLYQYGIINEKFKTTIANVINLLAAEQSRIMEDAEFLASKLKGKVIEVYAEDKYESTALRERQQINENSKLHCWYNVVPEMNHNELVGWREQNDALAVLFFRADDEYHRNTQRILFKKDVIIKLSENVFEIDAKGTDTFEKHYYLIHFGDWLSYYLGVAQGYDPMEIDVLNSLKGHMSSIK